MACRESGYGSWVPLVVGSGSGSGSGSGGGIAVWHFGRLKSREKHIGITTIPRARSKITIQK